MDAQLQQPTDGIAPFTRLILDLRGVCFIIERETLMSLPESVLLCLFPNGLVLSDNGMDEMGGDSAQDEHVYHVDFDAQCLQYVLSFFRRAQDYFYGTEVTQGVYRGGDTGNSYLDYVEQMNNSLMGYGAPFHLPFFHKQAVIVLREELEYFTIAPKSMGRSAAQPTVGNEPPSASPQFNHLKDLCGEVLLRRRQIFTALQRNISKENNVAEQHLIDMLCMSGFETDDLWGYRAREPARCGITSTALVLLKTGVTHPGELPEGRDGNQPVPNKPIGVEREGVSMEKGIDMSNTVFSEEQLGEWVDDGQGGMLRVNQHQLNTTQKLLLFWRKPARKCWWDGVTIIVPMDPSMQKAIGISRSNMTTSSLNGTTPEERKWLEQGMGVPVRVW
ncbi:hypothetical protein MVES_002396 [Malassezia vespertilionis]|uniref:Uncharacterized protein n=2 Tax=Malassezia vespertilionis TaxID=2020962 RepID=A0A2N1JAB7_9BASI|nr:hypothetical protein MVES_002396 [Malassezia vespertilionis]